ncbi:1676_t:CDS:2 [Funneliformis geosporum]|nr:1676_t:CDS:2 [Funneliformis geosporum]
MESLREIKEQLKACTSNQEYEAKKSNYIRKCEEVLQGLQVQTSSSSSMFGICIIWADQATNKVQELNQLKFEERQITQRMESNKRKAMSKDISPSEKVAILQIIEEDGQILKKNYEKQKEISNKFNFDPSKKANDLIEKMKRAIEKRNRGNSSSGGNKGNQTDSDDSDSDDEITENRGENPRTTPLNQEQNRQLLTIALLAGASYYFFLYLPKKRSKAIQEIKTMLQNSNVNLNDLNKCYSSSQINLFAKEMKREIQQKATVSQGKSIEELRKEAITNIENFAEKELRLAPSLEKDLKKFYKRIKQATNNDISIIEQESVDFIIQEKIKIQGLH